MKKKKLAGDMVYSISALLVMNGILQLVIYPLLNQFMGEAAFGNVLYILGIVSIIAPSVGLSANNTRLLAQKQCDTENSDYIIYVFSTSIVLGLFVLFFWGKSIDFPILFLMLLVFTSFRFYSDVNFRLNLNYKGYFIYYVILSAGYVIGLSLFQITPNWYLAMLLGEAAAVWYVVWKGNVYRHLKMVSPNMKSLYYKSGRLGISYLLYNAGVNFDKIILKNFADSSAVTQFYVVSLIGKTIAMVIIPLNSVIISYLAKDGTKVKRKQFVKFSIVLIGAGIFLLLGCAVATPIFIKLLYPQMYESTKKLILPASLAQIFCILSSVVTGVILTICSEKWQLIVQGLYAAVFLTAGVFLTLQFGIWGFTAASVLANTILFFSVIILGICKSERN